MRGLLRFTFSIVALSVALGIVCPSKDYAQQGNAGVMIDPAKGYDVKSYNATIWLNRMDTTLSGWVEMKAVSMGDLTDILQHAKYLSIDSVFVNSIRSTFLQPDSNGAYRYGVWARAGTSSRLKSSRPAGPPITTAAAS